MRDRLRAQTSGKIFWRAKSHGNTPEGKLGAPKRLADLCQPE